MQEDPQLYHAVRSLTNVSHSSLLASHTAAQSTQAFWLPLLRGSSPTTTTTAGRMQAEKHRSALPCRLRSTAPRCPQVPFRRQALSQDTASRSTSHDREATGAADSNGSVRQLDSRFITKRVSPCAPVYRARRGSSIAKWPLL